MSIAMKKLLCFIAIVLIFTSVAQGKSLKEIEQEKSLKEIEIVTGEWNPYTGNQLLNQGMASEIVRTVFNDMGYNMQLEFMPFSLGYEKTIKQEFRGIFPYFKTGRRTEEMFFSDKMFDTNISFFYIESNPELKATIESGNIKQTSDLEPYCIGLIQGYNYGEPIENLPRTRRFNSEINAFRGLFEADNLGIEEEDSCGRGNGIEILPAEQRVGEKILANYFRDKRYLISEIKQLEFILPVYFLMPKSEPANEKLIDEFNESLLKLKQNGIISAITLSYAEPETKSTGLVTLDGPASHPLVIGYEPTNNSNQCPMNSQSTWLPFATKRKEFQQPYDENCGYLIPKRTRALVIEWGEPFITPGNVKIHNQILQKSRVRILQGPLKDKELYVANIYISFE